MQKHFLAMKNSRSNGEVKMLKKYQVLELESGRFIVAIFSQFEKAAEAQELADELNGVSDEQ